jgi:hypothetical protein
VRTFRRDKVLPWLYLPCKRQLPAKRGDFRVSGHGRPVWRRFRCCLLQAAFVEDSDHDHRLRFTLAPDPSFGGPLLIPPNRLENLPVTLARATGRDCFFLALSIFFGHLIARSCYVQGFTEPSSFDSPAPSTHRASE